MFRRQANVSSGQWLLEPQRETVLITARNECGSCRGADCGICVRLCEANAPCSYAIDVRRGEVGPPITGHISVAEIVSHDEDDVRPTRRRLPGQPPDARY